MAGDKGLFWKTNLYEGSDRVPLVFCRPGLIRPGRRIKQLTSLLDLGPTLIDYTGAPELPETDGENLLALLKGDSPSAMIRKGSWKLVQHHGYKVPQLFNLAEDPGEINDLGGHPHSRSKCEELAAELSRRWDGGQVLDYITRLSPHIELLKQWFRLTKPETYDQWIGRPENNYLVPED
jgi:choline-sulfatase